MLKLYKRGSDGIFKYHEAWLDGETVCEHWGVVGERGQTKDHPCNREFSESDNVVHVLQSAIDDGFEPIEFEDHATLLIEYAVDGMGTRSDLDKRYSLQSRMDETLGWTGLGACDGGSIGSGTMEVCCFVVDFATARRVIAADLVGTGFSDFTRIYDENEDA